MENTVKRFIQAGLNGIKRADVNNVTSDELRFYAEAVRAMRKHPELVVGFPSVSDTECKWLQLKVAFADRDYPTLYSVLEPLNELGFLDSDD